MVASFLSPFGTVIHDAQHRVRYGAHLHPSSSVGHSPAPPPAPRPPRYRRLDYWYMPVLNQLSTDPLTLTAASACHCHSQSKVTQSLFILFFPPPHTHHPSQFIGSSHPSLPPHSCPHSLNHPSLLHTAPLLRS